MFAQNVRNFVRRLPKHTGNFEDGKQLIRSSGSVGANYIEANDSLGRQDFLMRIRISRKEAKESVYWLRLVDVGEDPTITSERVVLQKEATELMKIFGAILKKSK